MTYALSRSRFSRTVRACALFAAASVPLLAQGGGAAIKDLHRIDDYVLVVDGKTIPAAEMFQADRGAEPAILVLSSALPAPVLLLPRAQAVQTVNLMKVARQPDGTVDLLPGAPLAGQGPFTFGNGQVSFSVDGRKVALKEKPVLLGLQTAAALKQYSPATYVEGAKVYRPDPASITALRKAAAPVTVRVFFGSWCPHCQQSLPRLIKVEDQLKGSKVRFEYFGLPRDGMGQVPEFKKLKLDGVPSGVVFSGGREIGRLVGNQAWVAPEVALRSIVSGAGAPAKSR